MIGCVAYSPDIPGIWEGMRQHFISQGVAFDFCLFTTYDRQVEALFSGHIDVAWNGPLAHVRTMRRTAGQSLSLGMRDVDRDFQTHLVVREDSGIDDLSSMAGARLATASHDSPQGCNLPVQALQAHDGGKLLSTLHVTRFDRDLGKHGDTAAGELEVISALTAGEVDAGFVSGVMWDRALGAGEAGGLKVVSGVVPPFDHCQFDALPSLSAAKREAFSHTLFAMDYADPDQRVVMQQEGIRKQWEPPREEGYAAMHEALAHEPTVPFPPPRDTVDGHRFASLTVNTRSGLPVQDFVRSCSAVG